MSGSVSATGTIDETGGIATSGSITLTGAALNGTFGLITNTPEIVDPDGENLTIDTVFNPSQNPVVSSTGLGFASGYIGVAGNGYPEYANALNLWGNSPGNYSLFEGSGPKGSNIYVTYNGSMSVEAIPEPSTYAAILGAACLGFSVIRRKRLLP